MASLQARHARTCSTGKAWTPYAKAAMEGCDCSPSYYVVVRDGKKLHRERAGKDRQQAERALRKVGSQVDEDAYVPQKTIRFDVWGTQWLDGLERESSTVRSYRSTVGYAKRAFGDKVVRRIGVEDVKRMLELMREDGLGASTRAKHLRVLRACFSSAIAASYAGRNPVQLLQPGERPRPRKRESAYFTLDELPALLQQLEADAYGRLYEVALKTGMRQGELSALAWAEVDLVAAVIRVRRSYTDGELRAPKNHEKRDVYLMPEVVDLLGVWWGELGKPAEDTLVFPGATKSGYMNPDMLRRNLYAAMKTGGIPRAGVTGEDRTFHSLRHTFAKRALESGRPITWLSRHLGHSSTDITDTVYGHWEPSEQKREAAAMAGAFGGAS